MSTPHLPAELFDHVVDHLHDTEDALRNCCLVSKSLISRSRMHLFTVIRFDTVERLQSWKETFPDPQTPPAFYAETLSINCLQAVTAEDAEPGGWIGGFSRVVYLEVVVDDLIHATQSASSLSLFHGFSPAIKSIHVKFPVLLSSRILDFILSFPLLEDVTVITRYKPLADNLDGPNVLPTTTCLPAPPMTGSFELLQQGGTKHITRRLLSLPGGIHFRKLILTWCREEDILSTRGLVEGCSHTLESLHIACELVDSPRSFLIDLSKATRLKDTVFRTGSHLVSWITVALRTITLEHRDFQQISIYVPYYSMLVNVCANVRMFLGEDLFRRWLDLDRLLVQIWESRSIRARVMCDPRVRERRDMREYFEMLMPEVMRRAIVDLVE